MAEEDQWLDEEAGPVVRPYALTRGRTRPTGETLDLIALVTAIRGVEVDPVGLDPEHLALLAMCRLPASVADLAAGGFGAGKTPLVGAVTEIRALRTEEPLSGPGAYVDNLAGVERKTTTTVAMDFGSISI